MSILSMGGITDTPQIIITRDIIIFFALLLLIIFFVFRYIKRDISLTNAKEELDLCSTNAKEEFNNFLVKFEKTQRHQFLHIHSMMHKFRDDCFTGFRPRLSEISRGGVEGIDKRIFEDICHSITTELRFLFLHYFETRNFNIGDDLAITVKLIIPTAKIPTSILEASRYPRSLIESRDRWVVTTYRDPHTYEKYRGEREVGVSLYDIEKNTAYMHILKNQRPCFLCNDLRGLKENYLNETPNWERHYNSTLVVPIRYLHTPTNQCIEYGLLAADSLNPNGYELFNNKECKDLIANAADLLAIFFLMLEMSKRDGGSDERMQG